MEKDPRNAVKIREHETWCPRVGAWLKLQTSRRTGHEHHLSDRLPNDDCEAGTVVSPRTFQGIPASESGLGPERMFLFVYELQQGFQAFIPFGRLLFQL